MSEREIVVVLKPIRTGAPTFSTEAPENTPAGASLARVLESHGATLTPMFETTTNSPGLEAGDGNPELASITTEMARYYSVRSSDSDADALVDELRLSDAVETAYVKPATELPIAPAQDTTGSSRRPSIISTLGRPGVDGRGSISFDGAVQSVPTVQTPSIPNFRSRQQYLDDAPAGVAADYGWSFPGGKGEDVKVIDIEGDWHFSHVDLRTNGGGLLGGSLFNEVGWRNHGTAVMGEIGGDENNFGVVGISPNATLSAVSHRSLGSARAIQLAAGLLRAGDVLLLEMHRAGPRHQFQERNDQRGYIAVEWWADDFLAIQFATARGVIVVEAAGNGAENLDDLLYDTPHPAFPSSWRNPFRGAADSGAIVVGAGAPPPDTHGRNHGPDRSRLDFSNYGSRVDCQGWGREVTTTGYSDLFGAQLDEDYWFTDTFSGTSSASPIVTGVIAVLQGIAKGDGKLLTPQQARALLRAQGSPQTDGPGRPATQRIGLRPDLRKLIPVLQAIV